MCMNMYSHAVELVERFRGMFVSLNPIVVN